MGPPVLSSFVWMFVVSLLPSHVLDDWNNNANIRVTIQINIHAYNHAHVYRPCRGDPPPRRLYVCIKGYGHSIMNLVYFLRMLSSERMKREEGPLTPGCGGGPFLPPMAP